MPEPENTNALPSEEYNDDGSKNPDYVAPGTEDKGVADTKTGTEGADDTPDEDQGDFNDTIDPEKGIEVPTRASTLQNIIARKNNTIDKLKSKADEPSDDGDDDDDLDEDTRNAISKKVDKTLAPILDTFANEAESKEFDAFLASTPEAKKFTNHIKAYMKHDAYKGVPPLVIYHHLAFSVAQAIGAKKKNAADLEAKQMKGPGRTIVADTNISDIPSAEDIDNMSEAEFEKMQQDALMGKFVKR